jgi:F-type H+-transporting ATPase subunit epsilon
MRLSVTTPRGSLVDTDVEEVIAPGAVGELGVLPGHVPLMSALKPGVLIYRSRDRVATLAVGEGFLQVAPMVQGDNTQDRVLVLVDQAVAAGSVDRAAAERDLSQADAQLAAWKRDLDGEYHALLVRRQWAAARLDAAARAAPAR